MDKEPKLASSSRAKDSGVCRFSFIAHAIMIYLASAGLGEDGASHPVYEFGCSSPGWDHPPDYPEPFPYPV